MSIRSTKVAALTIATLLTATTAPVVSAYGYQPSRTVVYLTRHAEKLTVQTDEGLDNCALDAKGKLRCEEALNALGEKRAELLANWFESQGVIYRATHVISSDKQRTRQTIAPTAAKISDTNYYSDLLDRDIEDGIVDGVMQIPAGEPMAQAILDLPAGSVAIVAAHSGTIYKILGGDDTDGNPATGDDDSVGLGIDTTIGDNFSDVTLFPKKESNGKVRDFGDLWKIVINNDTGKARVVWRKSLQPQSLQLQDATINYRGFLYNRYW